MIAERIDFDITWGNHCHWQKKPLSEGLLLDQIAAILFVDDFDLFPDNLDVLAVGVAATVDKNHFVIPSG